MGFERFVILLPILTMYMHINGEIYNKAEQLNDCGQVDKEMPPLQLLHKVQ